MPGRAPDVAVTHADQRRAIAISPAFYGASAAIFITAAGLTISFSRTMSMSMPMPGGWNMSMMWMEVASGSARPALSFVAMWVAMMVAMMLPSAAPMLLLYRRVVMFTGHSRIGIRTWLLGAGYFAAWAVFGAAVCIAGALIARAAMASSNVSRAMPALGGLALVVAGTYQLAPWKRACLRHCREPFSLLTHHVGPRLRSALALGLHHGAYCMACCWGLMLIQLVLGVMNIYVMVAIALVIAMEKLLPSGRGVARCTGIAAIAAGVVLAAVSLHRLAT